MIESRKLRVAVGAIDDFDQLQDTIGELAALGAVSSDAVVLTIPGNLCERLLNTSDPADDGEGRDWPTILVRSKGGNSLVEPPSAEQDGAGSTVLVDLSAKFEDWIEPRLARNLNNQLANGACLLFVQIASAETELAISNALLSHSLDLVQFHDVAPPI